MARLSFLVLLRTNLSTLPEPRGRECQKHGCRHCERKESLGRILSIGATIEEIIIFFADFGSSARPGLGTFLAQGGFAMPGAPRDWLRHTQLG